MCAFMLQITSQNLSTQMNESIKVSKREFTFWCHDTYDKPLKLRQMEMVVEKPSLP